jgi:type I restriction enzyme S subunit
MDDEIRSPWPSRRLGEICRVDYGLTASATGVPGGPRFLRITDIVDGPIDWTRVPYCLATEHERGRYRLEHGDVVVARTGASVGAAAYIQAPPGAVFASYLVRMKASPELESRFLYYWLGSQRWKTHIDGIASGKSAQPNASASAMATFTFPLPPVETQRAMAGVLAALDDKIESNARKAATSESILDVLATDVADMGLVPLSVLVTSDRAQVSPMAIGDNLVDHYSIPAFDKDRWPERSPATSIKSGKFKITERSILVSRLNPRTPRVWLAGPTDVPALCSTEFLVLRPTVETNLASIWLAVRGRAFLDVLLSRVTGTSGSHQRVAPEDALAIEVPDIRLLSAGIAHEAEQLLELALQARREVSALRRFRDALLPELLSGRVRPDDPVPARAASA